jgi:ribosomal-protein-alanine N-acetyltransferase
MPPGREKVRLLTIEDGPLIERLLRTSEYIYQRFTPEELPLLLEHGPCVGFFHGSSLHGFLLSQSINPPTAWIGGFGVSWTESRAYRSILSRLLAALSTELISCNVFALHYSGNDALQDWLHTVLLSHNFVPYRYLYSYDKFDYAIPSPGNQQVTVRPVDLSAPLGKDMQALLAIEEVCFEDLWRYNSTAFSDILATHPYFVVAELNDQVVGYQFNAIDGDYGYLVRIAVHPAVGGRGIGARLMAEAINFFAQARVSRIMLNTQQDNVHAHRLYEWFGFIRLEQTGFVLRKEL